MSERVRLPGGRDVRATVDRPDADRVVVACPPHPQIGGDRRDSRLRAVSDALADHGIGCLRFDYGPWDEGRGEQTDVRTALSWARERSDEVGLFGYSFGGGVAVLAAAAAFDADDDPPDSVAVLAPAGTLGDESVAAAVDRLDCPLLVVYGERDDTVDAVPVAERARECGHAVESVPADHFYAGQQNEVAERIAAFLSEHSNH
jgi:hypothetical protein